MASKAALAKRELAKREVSRRKVAREFKDSPAMSDDAVKFLNNAVSTQVLAIHESNRDQLEALEKASNALSKGVESAVKSSAQTAEKSAKSHINQLDKTSKAHTATIAGLQTSIAQLAEQMTMANQANVEALQVVMAALSKTIDAIKPVDGAEIIRDSRGNLLGVKFIRG